MPGTKAHNHFINSFKQILASLKILKIKAKNETIIIFINFKSRHINRITANIRGSNHDKDVVKPNPISNFKKSFLYLMKQITFFRIGGHGIFKLAFNSLTMTNEE